MDKKPKFVPVAKRKPTSEELAAASAAAASANNHNSGSDKNEKPSRGKDNWKERREREDRGGRGSGGRGRGGRWSTPNTNNSNEVNLEDNKVSSSSGVAIKVEKMELKSQTGSFQSLIYNTHMVKESNDDNDSDLEGENEAVIVEEGKEIWPPLSFDPSQPLSLPFGPKTISKRTEIANLPIFADVNDEMAMSNEERTSTFLIQLPSDLKLKPVEKIVNKNPSNIPVSLDEDTEIPHFLPPSSTSSNPSNSLNSNSNSNQKPLIGAGKIGKIQVMKSGKIYLTTNSGDRFEIWSGMDVAFAQYLASISVNQTDNTSSSQPPTSFDQYSKMTSTKDDKTAKKDGDFYLLSDISRKLVVSPAYLIGKQQSQTTPLPVTQPTFPECILPKPKYTSVLPPEEIAKLLPSNNKPIKTFKPFVKTESFEDKVKKELESMDVESSEEVFDEKITSNTIKEDEVTTSQSQASQPFQVKQAVSRHRPKPVKK